MDNQGSPAGNSSLQNTSPLTTQPSVIANQQHTAFNMLPNPSSKQEVHTPLLIVLFFTYMATVSVVALIIADLIAGVANGAPETGFGMVLAIVLSPIAIGLITSSVLRIRKLKKQGLGVARTVKLSALLFAAFSIVSVGYEVGNKVYVDNKNATESAKLRKANVDESITISYAAELLNTCKIWSVHDITNSAGPIVAEVANSSEGIILGKSGGKPFILSADSVAYAKLKPAMENASKNCHNFTK